MHTIGGNSQRLGIILRSERFTLPLRIRPERTLQTFLTIRSRTLRSHVTFHNLVIRQVTARSIEQLLLLGLDTVKDRHRMVRGTIIVAPHHRFIICIRTDDSDFLCILLQRKNLILVLQ